MKNVRLPLSAKITGLFVLNLLVLVVAGYLLMRQHWSFAALPAVRSQKLDFAASAIVHELDQTPLRQWDNVLAAAGEKYGVTFFLYSQRGPRLAGPSDRLPGHVHNLAIIERPQRRGPAPRPPEFGDAPPSRRGDGPPEEFGEPPHRRGGGPPDEFGEPPHRRGEGPPDEFGEPPHRRGGGPPDESGEAAPPRRASKSEPPAEVSTADKNPSDPNDPPPVLMSPEGYWSYAFTQVDHDDYSGKVALIARSDSPTGHGFYSDHQTLYWGIAGLIVASVLVWLPFVRSTTLSVKQMQSAATKIAGGDFTTRVNDKRLDELGALGKVVNHMADQIGSLVDGQKRLLGDIAHELSSPIARMQAVVGILENQIGANGNPDSQRYLTRLDDELQHMGQLVQELLSLSKASLKRTIELRPLALEPLLQRVIQREQQNNAMTRLHVPPGLRVMSDPELLSRAVGNVLRNSIRYASQGEPIDLSAELEGENVVIRVRDHGPGVPEAALPYLFDAFYRPDTARTRETGGSGLGLAIAKTCVEATGGEITAANRAVGGLEVEITQILAA
ncbi:MAG TPA: ATP-binding protein [Luteolibacter sp.]